MYENLYKNFLRHKKTAILFILLSLVIPTLFLIKPSPRSQNINNNLPTQSPEKAWDIVFAYDTQTKKLSVKSITITKAVAVASKLTFSPYKLFVYDKNNNVLFQSHIHITERVIADPPPLSSQPTMYESTITIPYLVNADRIVVTRHDQSVVNLTPPKTLLFSPKTQTFAQGNSCNPLNLVFIGDGYNDPSAFTADFEKAKQTILATEPYKSNTSKINILMVENNDPLGCVQGNGGADGYCVIKASTQNKVKNKTFENYPTLPRNAEYTKYIVFTQTSNPTMHGLTNKIGGDMIWMHADTTYLSSALLHELGHSVGYLEERYVAKNVTFQTAIEQEIREQNYRSNCTENPAGETFWQTVREPNPSNAYPGCGSPNLYAPGPRDCSDSNAGPKDTVMGALCNEQLGYDDVETYYIRTEIMPTYSSCATETPTTSPQPTTTPSPTSTQTNNCRDLTPDETIPASFQYFSPSERAKYIWKAISCSASSCYNGSDRATFHDKCPKNTSDANINPNTSNWCYDFGGRGNSADLRCIQLQRIQTATTPTPTQAPSSSALLVTEANIGKYDLENQRGRRCLNIDDLNEIVKVMVQIARGERVDEEKSKSNLNDDASVDILDARRMIEVLSLNNNTRWLCTQ